MHVCPAGAISMLADNEGFLYPYIDETKCTECLLCKSICPFRQLRDATGHFETPQVYAARHKDDRVRSSSSSGGMFTALSDYILDNHGVVYGAAFDPDFNVRHIKAENRNQRDLCKGSKYVQSSLDNTFVDVKAELDQGRHVLFTGTPCQTAGLKAYLGSAAYEKMILCDLVCHGTPSPLIWRDYIDLLVRKKGASLQSFYFRDKSAGWHSSRLYAEFSNGSTLSHTALLDCFNNIFYSHMALRPACHACVFTNFQRPSDITIADFWGIELCKPEFDDDKGVSLVLLNTTKGKNIFENINKCLLHKQSNVEECKQRQRHLMEPATRSPLRDAFWKDYHNNGFEYVAKKYTNYGLLNRFKQKILKPMLDKSGILNFIRSVR